MTCSHCGKEVADKNAARCASCGHTLDGVDEETLFDEPTPEPTSQTARSPRETPTEVVPKTAGTGRSSSSSSATGRAPSQSGSGARSGSGSGSGLRAPTSELLPSTVFADRYEIGYVLGEGGMGIVYKALDLELNKVIALKTIRGSGNMDPDMVQRFKRELILARGITHKNVVRIHDFGEAEGIKYFTMAFIEGDSLKSLIRDSGRLSAKEALPVVRQILSALVEAHSQGVVHRDLKPQNVMIDPNGDAHIMDFGIARSAEATELTDTGVLIGTPDYMSPEQVKGQKATEQSDLYSFGVILYEMLTGAVPFKADTPASKVMMRLSHKPQAPRQISLEIPKYLERVVLKCLEVDPALRYQSAQEVLDDIAREHVDHSITLRVQRAVGRRKAWIGAVAVVAALAGLVVYFQGRSSTPTEASLEGLAVDPTTVAILPLTNATGSQEHDWLRRGIPDMLFHDVAQSQFVRPVPSERVLTVMRELGVSENTRFDEPTLDAIAKRVPAESILYGQFIESGGELRVDLTSRKTSSGVPTPIRAQMPASDVFALVDEITARFKENLDLPPDALRSDVDRPVTDVVTASLDALRAYENGLGELAEGNNLEGAEFLETATREDPAFAMAYAKLAEARFRLGQRREAQAAINRAVRLAESSERPLALAERYQIHATAALVEDDYATAATSLEELSALYPADPEIRMSLARAYEEMAHLDDAMSAYERVIAFGQRDESFRTAHDYGAALLGRGRILVMSGQSEDAIASLKDALETKQFDDDPEALGMIHSVLGVAHREIGELDLALTHLSLSLEARTESGDLRGQAATLYNTASIYEYRGEIEKALDAERQALALARELGDPEEESIALNNMGLTYKMAGRLDEALESFRDAFRIEMDRGDDAEIANRLDHIADIYQLKGQYDDAIVYLERAQSYLAKTDDKLEKSINLGYLASVRRAQGLYDDAVAAFLEGIAISREIEDPVGVLTLQKNLSRIYVWQGRFADAYGALSESLDIANELHVEHDIAEVQVPLGSLLVQLGRFDAAEERFAEAEQVVHDAHAASELMPEVQLGRAEILQFRGEIERAAEVFQEANVAANLSGMKEVAVASRIALGRIYLRQGKIPNAQRLLERTRTEAADSRLRPLESDALAALATVHLVNGDAESARRSALDAISLAEAFSGRPTLIKAYSSLGEALGRLGRSEEAVDAHRQSVEIVQWVVGGLTAEQVDGFVARPDVRGHLRAAMEVFERSGHREEASALEKWVAVGSSTASEE